MKRINFIAPVESMQGNLSGKRVLEYPLNDNPAFDAPEGKSYARNYLTRFIGARRVADGKIYFSVKTKSAVHKTAASILAMAALGAAGAIVGAILADKTSALYIALQDAYVSAKPMKDGKAMSFRKWLSSAIMPVLRSKSSEIKVWYVESGLMHLITINNPFVSGGTATYNVTISNDVLVKFWNALANNPLTFTVAGQKGIAHTGDTFGTIIASNYNVLGLTSEANPSEGDDVVKSGEMFVNYFAEGDEITAWVSTTVVSDSYILSEEYETAG